MVPPKEPNVATRIRWRYDARHAFHTLFQSDKEFLVRVVPSTLSHGVTRFNQNLQGQPRKQAPDSGWELGCSIADQNDVRVGMAA